MAERLTNLPLPRRWQQQLHPMPSVVAIISREMNDTTGYLLIMKGTTALISCCSFAKFKLQRAMLGSRPKKPFCDSPQAS